jgi:hypothetical protein
MFQKEYVDWTQLVHQKRIQLRDFVTSVLDLRVPQGTEVHEQLNNHQLFKINSPPPPHEMLFARPTNYITEFVTE